MTFPPATVGGIINAILAPSPFFP